MADSPAFISDGHLRVSITCDGTSIQDRLDIRSIIIHREFNAIAWARLVLLDGDMPNGQFPLSDEKSFEPGAVIKISAGYQESQEQENPLFEGVVMRHSFRIDASGDAVLIVECRDRSSVMTIGRKNANYIDKKDSDVLSALIANAGLISDVATTSVTHRELIQYDCSDWDFMLARAEANGLLVLVRDGKVSIKAPDVSPSPVLTVTWGVDLIEFNADVDARTQFSKVQAVSWDPKSQNIVQGNLAQPLTLNVQGNLDGAILSKVVGENTLGLQSCAPQEKESLDQWAKATQLKAELARIRGRMRFQGSAKAEVGSMIELKGVGKRFAGNVLVSSVQHELVRGNWMTEAGFGLDPSWHVARQDVQAPAAGALFPGVVGLQIGVVLKLDGDPSGEHKIQVKVPVMQNDVEGVWARLMQPLASRGFGAFFPPEVGDEVVLGYFNEDPCHPVVLGSLYSSNHKPPYALEAKNNTKAFVSRYQHKLAFDEEKKTITIATPGPNTMVLDDTNKKITLQDQNGNKVELSPDGIVLDSPSDIKLSAKGTLTLDAVGAISITSKADVKVGGLNVNCEGQVGFTGKGSATAELSASGQTTVKGAMVMIN